MFNETWVPSWRIPVLPSATHIPVSRNQWCYENWDAKGGPPKAVILAEGFPTGPEPQREVTRYIRCARLAVAVP